MRKLSTKQIQVTLFLFPIVYFLIFLSIKIIYPDIYMLIIQEDTIIEYMQAFIYFLSSIFAFIISIRFINNRFILHGILYFILFIGLLFVSIEEISWGQRIFGIEIPRYFENHNVQNEISIHNLKHIQSSLHKIYILVGLYGAFAWLFLGKIKIKSDNIMRFVVPEWFISSYFFVLFFVYFYFDFISPFCVHILGIEEFHIGAFVLWRDQEPAELLLSLGFLIFTIVNYIKSRIICLTNA